MAEPPLVVRRRPVGEGPLTGFRVRPRTAVGRGGDHPPAGCAEPASGGCSVGGEADSGPAVRAGRTGHAGVPGTGTSSGRLRDAGLAGPEYPPPDKRATASPV